MKTTLQRREQRERAQERHNEMMKAPQIAAQTRNLSNMIEWHKFFGITEPKPLPPSTLPSWIKVVPEQKKEETNMNTSINMTSAENIELKQRNYLGQQLDKILSQKDQDLQKKFNLNGMDLPKTINQAIQLLKDGKFKIVNDIDADFELDTWMQPLSYIRFEDPAIKPDRTGYQAAEKLLRAAGTKIARELMIRPLDQALDALTAFEASE